MTEKDVSVTWVKDRNILAFPYGWQRPAKTEEWVYEQCLNRLPESIFFQLVCFPWATLIDLLRKQQCIKARTYIDKLNAAAPSTSLIRATVCQHIYAKDMLPWFKQLKITDLYWCHATVSEQTIDGIRIHPFPLYPVRCYDHKVSIDSINKPLINRKYLYSFIGAYDDNLYLTSVRQHLFNLPQRHNVFIKCRAEWHYEKHVYQDQIFGVQIKDTEEQLHCEQSREYTEVMQETVFSLCPSGSGPNSIRIWESFGFGCIPVILSDDLQLPGDRSLWSKAVIQVNETASSVNQLPTLLENLFNRPEQLKRMQEAGRKLWKLYGEQGPITILSELTQLGVVSGWVLS